jgi:hypothetical protein
MDTVAVSPLVEMYALMEGLPIGSWVAYSENQHKILAYGPDAQAVWKEAEEKGESRAIVTRVLDPHVALFL